MTSVILDAIKKLIGSQEVDADVLRTCPVCKRYMDKKKIKTITTVVKERIFGLEVQKRLFLYMCEDCIINHNNKNKEEKCNLKT